MKKSNCEQHRRSNGNNQTKSKLSEQILAILESLTRNNLSSSAVTPVEDKPSPQHNNDQQNTFAFGEPRPKARMARRKFRSDIAQKSRNRTHKAYIDPEATLQSFHSR